MIKRLLCILLCVVSLVSLFSFPKAEAANESVKTQLIQLYMKFPHGKYWNHVGSSVNNPDGVTDTPCPNHYSCSWKYGCSCNMFDNAIQCMGYAYKIAYEIVGVSARQFTKSYTLDASKLRVGDVIRFKWDTHSLTVTGVKGDVISFTDNNWIGRCQIRWATMDLSEIRNRGFSYVLHYEGNDRKNTDLEFYEDALQPDNTEKWVNASASSLNIRSGHTVDSECIASIPSGNEFYVYRHYSDGNYLWGKVKYGAYTGWCALNWSKYVSTKGKSVEPAITTTETRLYYADATIRWASVEGADNYVLKIFDKNGNKVVQYNTTKCYQTLDIQNTGDFTARVYAKSSFASSWLPKSKVFDFTLVRIKPVYVDDISMKNSLTLVCGSTKTLSAKVLPENASDKTLTWKSSDTSIATVSADGKITAKKCGYVDIICTSQDKNGYSEKCTVKVKPATVQKLKQTDKKRDSSISLKWNASKGATYYVVYMLKNGEYEKIGQTKELTFTVDGLKKNKNYTFKVVAVYKKGSVKINASASDKLKATA